MRRTITVLAVAATILLASAGDAFAQRGGGGRGGSGGGRGGSGWGGGYRQGGYGNNYYGGGFGYSPYYQDSGLMYGFAPYGAGYGYAPNYISPEPYSYSTQSFYSPAQGSAIIPAAYATQQPIVQQPTAQQAFVSVKVPTADTELWFGSTQIAPQSGTDRLIYSPDLEAGKTYTYKVTARWTVDGKAMEKIHEVEVHAGQTSTTDFRKAKMQPAPMPEAAKDK